jgi:hypothetical protein
VDAMTDAEALSYARQISISLSDDELRRFFDTVGTLPVQINNLLYYLDNGMSLNEIIESEIDHARKDLVRFPLTKLLLALKME